MIRTIDLNCDLGENPARIADGSDLALLDLVTSANIACGGHAGDESTMRAVIRAARERCVKIGAHPGYPDRANFGRVEMPLSISDLKCQISDQITTLAGIARSEGTSLHHVKPHGALYHAAMARREVAQAVADAAASADPSLVLVGLCGAPALDVWRSMGFAVMAEAFADRRYEAGGSLRSRGAVDALIVDPREAAEQALRMARDGVVIAAGGASVPVRADTICIHADTPNAIDIASRVRRELESAGIAVA
jgi:UPF0271 protein